MTRRKRATIDFFEGVVYDAVVMKKINVPTKKMDQFAGKWVAIDTVKERIIAAGETLKEIAPLITRSATDKTPADRIPAAFKVPRKDEGPYVLWMRKAL